MSFSRLQTSQSRLQVDWQFAPDGDILDVNTLEEAVAYMGRRSGGKPILVNLEIEERDPKVKKLYDAALKSERFTLASKWFHCVKVGDEVLHADHPLHQLFEGKNPAALVMVSPDLSKQVSFLGTARQKVKWAPIARVLRAAYKKDATAAVKGLESLLCKFDALDSRQNELNSQLARAEKAENASKIAAIQEKQAETAKEFEIAFAEETKLRELVLKNATGDDE